MTKHRIMKADFEKMNNRKHGNMWKRVLCFALSLALLRVWPVYAATSQQQWFDDNTVYIDSELYGFDHRIETYLFIGTDASGNEDAEGEDYHGAMADFLLFFVMDHTDDTYGAIQIDRNTMTSVTLLDEFGEWAEEREMQICTSHWYGIDPESSAENT